MSEDVDHLDRLRIQQHAQLRRSIYRSRSYCIIAAAGCAVGAVQLAWLAFRDIRAAGWHPIPVAYILLGLAGILGCVWFVNRGIELHREARACHRPEIETAPDFSTLSDGSQLARNLEDVH